MKLLIFACLVLAISVVVAENTLDPLSDEFIDAINNAQSSWKAGRNFPLGTPMTFLKSLLGQLPENITEVLPARPFHPSRLEDIPEHFDARDQWPGCPSIRMIRDQGECGSCWAVSTTSAMTDRTCIQSNGKTYIAFSAGDLLSCASTTGCDGGFSAEAWKYWVNSGIASGGDYGEDYGCIPYPFPPCNHDSQPTSKPFCTQSRKAPACKTYCDTNTQVPKSRLVYFGKSAYRLSTETEIQDEILKNGPVTGVLSVYEDFGNFKSGVYHHTMGNFTGLHAIRIIGWGVENSTPYWLIANSWNEDWGDRGLFKIRRGNDECGIESRVSAGQPDV